ncbi:MAG: AAA family ATPase [Eubacteriaceae bacterium]|nr:AAA family ATPase [Eubacteriaceae bacterium]
MSFTIAVAGKGGTGKTTICGMMIDYLVKTGKGPILAVDADANSNLNEVLGVEIETTIGEIREEVNQAENQLKSPIPAGMTKADYINFKFQDVLTETKDYDMLVMGRTQGEGCYCYVNGMLKTQLQRFSDNYRYIVVDNEAGMEHISRGILPKVDVILLVSDCSRRGIQAVGRIAKLVKDLKLNPKTMGLIVNRVPDGVLPEGVREEIALQELELIGVVPQDETIFRYDNEGRPSSTVPEDCPSKKAVTEIMNKLDI